MATALSSVLHLTFILLVVVQLGCCVLDDARLRERRLADSSKPSSKEKSNGTLSDQGKPSAREAAIQRILNDHDPKIPPDFEKDFPTEVTVQVFIVSFDSISEATMDYSVSIFLRQTWVDQRMTYNKLPGVDMLELDTRVMGEVWVPDLFFTNEKRASFHEVTVPNKLMHVYPNGNILYSSRNTLLKHACTGHQQHYSSEACPEHPFLAVSMMSPLFQFPLVPLASMSSVVFPSYVFLVGSTLNNQCHELIADSYSTKNVIFRWHDTPIITRDHLKLPQFQFDDTQNVDCTKEYKETGGSNYTCIRADFYLSRSYGYYVAQVYIPSVLIVSLSWVSFWLDIEAVPARISLGLLTVLTMTTQSANARAHLPRVSYIKAIDVWMATCLFFVFAALIEFAYVNVNSRVEKRRTNQSMIQAQGGLKLTGGGGGKGNGYNSETDDSEAKPKRLFSKTTIGRAKARRLDKLSRYIFPAVFAAFNIFYWLFYMFWEPEVERYD
ncbi:glycine receptor subunit alphaZ1 [Aplysia californica]|uniref:Glycine receptor subunit alphaZ1 n=1 Tax=Aplysia californica TaxID=6500 RepID=A0ABM1ABP4_APLCA|nr:glycine receptor subunit alphaZ1 [Aplysia californica]